MCLFGQHPKFDLNLQGACVQSAPESFQRTLNILLVGTKSAPVVQEVGSCGMGCLLYMCEHSLFFQVPAPQEPGSCGTGNCATEVK